MARSHRARYSKHVPEVISHDPNFKLLGVAAKAAGTTCIGVAPNKGCVRHPEETFQRPTRPMTQQAMMIIVTMNIS